MYPFVKDDTTDSFHSAIPTLRYLGTKLLWGGGGGGGGGGEGVIIYSDQQKPLMLLKTRFANAAQLC